MALTQDFSDARGQQELADPPRREGLARAKPATDVRADSVAWEKVSDHVLTRTEFVSGDVFTTSFDFKESTVQASHGRLRITQLQTTPFAEFDVQELREARKHWGELNALEQMIAPKPVVNVNTKTVFDLELPQDVVAPQKASFKKKAFTSSG